MNPLLGVLLLTLHPAPAVIKRIPKLDDRATYAMQALIDLGGKNDVKYTGTWVEKVKAVDDKQVTTAVESRVSVDILGVVRQGRMIASDRVERLDGLLLTGAETDSTLQFGIPRIDRLRSCLLPSGPVEIGSSWWRTYDKDDSMKAPPASSYMRLDGEEKIDMRDTWRVRVEANEVEIENPAHVRGMLWLDKADGSLVKGQWAIDGFTYGPDTPPLKARIEFRRTG